MLRASVAGLEERDLMSETPEEMIKQGLAMPPTQIANDAELKEALALTLSRALDDGRLSIAFEGIQHSCEEDFSENNSPNAETAEDARSRLQRTLIRAAKDGRLMTALQKEAAAAVKIQTAYRLRKEVSAAKDPAAETIQTMGGDDLPDLEDPEVQAATAKIQAAARKRKEKQEAERKRKEDPAAETIQTMGGDDLPDLDDPEVQAATAKIQAAARKRKEKQEAERKRKEASGEGRTSTSGLVEDLSQKPVGRDLVMQITTPSLADPSYPDVTVERSVEYIDGLKTKANIAFAANQVAEAVTVFSQAVELLEANVVPGVPTSLATIIYSNRAFAYIKLEKWVDAEADCSAALDLAPTNIKARYRRAMARTQLRKRARALEDIEDVLRVLPKEQATEAELLKERIEMIEERIEESVEERVDSTLRSSNTLTPLAETPQLARANSVPANVKTLEKQKTLDKQGTRPESVPEQGTRPESELAEEAAAAEKIQAAYRRKHSDAAKVDKRVAKPVQAKKKAVVKRTRIEDTEALSTVKNNLSDRLATYLKERVGGPVHVEPEVDEVTLDQFVYLCKSVLGLKHEEALLRSCFQSLDDDHAGKVPVDRLFKLLQAAAGSTEEGSGDANLCPTSLKALVRKTHSRLKAAALNNGQPGWLAFFREVDGDRSGEISWEEFYVMCRRKLQFTENKEQLRDVFRLVDGNGSGTVSIEELAKALSHEVPEAVENLRSRLKTAAYTAKGSDWVKVFQDVDKDKSGEIGWEEFFELCRRKLRLKDPDDYLRALFNWIDNDGSGHITISELICFVGSGPEALPQRNQVSRKEDLIQEERTRLAAVFTKTLTKHLDQTSSRFRAAAYTLKGTDFAKLFREVDTDKNGTISWDEFYSMCRRKLQMTCDESQIRAIFQVVDADGDGRVSSAELAGLLLYNKDGKRAVSVPAVKSPGGSSYGPIDLQITIVRIKGMQKACRHLELYFTSEIEDKISSNLGANRKSQGFAMGHGRSNNVSTASVSRVAVVDEKGYATWNHEQTFPTYFPRDNIIFKIWSGKILMATGGFIYRRRTNDTVEIPLNSTSRAQQGLMSGSLRLEIRIDRKDDIGKTVENVNASAGPAAEIAPLLPIRVTIVSARGFLQAYPGRETMVQLLCRSSIQSKSNGWTAVGKSKSAVGETWLNNTSDEVLWNHKHDFLDFTQGDLIMFHLWSGERDFYASDVSAVGGLTYRPGTVREGEISLSAKGAVSTLFLKISIEIIHPEKAEPEPPKIKGGRSRSRGALSQLAGGVEN